MLAPCRGFGPPSRRPTIERSLNYLEPSSFRLPLLEFRHFGRPGRNQTIVRMPAITGRRNLRIHPHCPERRPSQSKPNANNALRRRGPLGRPFSPCCFTDSRRTLRFLGSRLPPGARLPAKRYPIIDITGKDMQPILQTLPVGGLVQGGCCGSGKLGNAIGGRVAGGSFDAGRDVS